MARQFVWTTSRFWYSSLQTSEFASSRKSAVSSVNQVKSVVPNAKSYIQFSIAIVHYLSKNILHSDIKYNSMISYGLLTDSLDLKMGIMALLWSNRWQMSSALLKRSNGSSLASDYFSKGKPYTNINNSTVKMKLFNYTVNWQRWSWILRCNFRWYHS